VELLKGNGQSTELAPFARKAVEKFGGEIAKRFLVKNRDSQTHNKHNDTLIYIKLNHRDHLARHNQAKLHKLAVKVKRLFRFLCKLKGLQKWSPFSQLRG